MGRSRLAIVIPARNEEKTIKKVVLSLKGYGDILVVDDASRDNTKIILNKLKTKVIRNQKNLGYEGTLLKGIKYCLKKNYQYIATFDADDEHDSKFFKNVLKLKNFDLLIGKRSKFNRISEYFFSFITKLFFNFEDPLSGLKIYNTQILKKIKLKNENLLNVYIIFRILGLNGIIRHKKLNVKKRKDGSRIGNSFLINTYIIYCVFKLFFKIFFSKIKIINYAK